MRTACSLIVIPRSRSRSIESSTWFCMSRWLIDPVYSSRRSASVDLPWSMWAMMQKFRTRSCVVRGPREVTAQPRTSRGVVSWARCNARGDENTGVGIVLVIGVLLFAAGFVLLLNLFGAADLVMRRVTSQPLGELAPGFAASRRGFRIYAVLVLAIGVLCLGLAATAWFIPLGAGLLVLGALTFGIASVVAIAGEVETYRALRR